MRHELKIRMSANVHEAQLHKMHEHRSRQSGVFDSGQLISQSIQGGLIKGADNKLPSGVFLSLNFALQSIIGVEQSLCIELVPKVREYESRKRLSFEVPGGFRWADRRAEQQ